MVDNRKAWSPPQIIWSAIAGIVVWSAVGFSWFGYGFDWTTKGSVNAITANAVADSLATICVAQARGAPDSQAALEKFKGLSTWTQGEFVEKAQWATMPGSESPQGGVVAACVTKLRETS